MQVKTYINEGPGMFWRYEPGDRLVAGPVLEMGPLPKDQPWGTPEAQVLDQVWTIGNRMAPDAIGTFWPNDVRSLSTGDVIVIGELAWSVASVGFDRVETYALEVSLSEFAKENPRMAEHRLAKR